MLSALGAHRPSILGSSSSRSPAAATATSAAVQASKTATSKSAKSPARTPNKTRVAGTGSSSSSSKAAIAGSSIKLDLKSNFSSPGNNSKPKDANKMNETSAAVTSGSDIRSYNNSNNSNLAKIGSLIWSNSDAAFSNRQKVSPKLSLLSAGLAASTPTAMGTMTTTATPAMISAAAVAGGMETINEYVTATDISYLSPPNSKFSSHGNEPPANNNVNPTVPDNNCSLASKPPLGASLFSQATGLKSGLDIGHSLTNSADNGAKAVADRKSVMKRTCSKKKSVRGSSADSSIPSNTDDKINKKGIKSAVNFEKNVVEFVYDDGDDDDIEEFSNDSFDAISRRTSVNGTADSKKRSKPDDGKEKPPLPKSGKSRTSTVAMTSATVHHNNGQTTADPETVLIVGEPSPHTVIDLLSCSSNSSATATASASNSKQRKRSYAELMTGDNGHVGIAGLFVESPQKVGKSPDLAARNGTSIANTPSPNVINRSHVKGRPGTRVSRTSEASPSRSSSSDTLNTDGHSENNAAVNSSRPQRKLRVPVKHVNVLFPPKQLQFVVKQKDP